MDENQTIINNLLDETSRYFDKHEEHLEEEKGRIIIPIIFGIILILGVSGNGFVIYSYISRKQIRSLTNTLIVNLAIADLLFLVICIPFVTFRFVASVWPFGDVGCKISQYCIYVSVYVSIYTLVLMSVNRYCAIIYPLKTIRFRTKRNIIIAIVLTWAIFLLVFTPAFFQFTVHKYISMDEERSICENSEFIGNVGKERVFFTMYTVFSYILPLMIVTILYCLIVKRVLNTKDPSLAAASQDINQERMLRKKRVTRMIFVIVATFALCWLPYHIIILSRKFGAWDLQTTEEINTYVSLLLAAKCTAYANSCMNPFLYLFMSRAFRSTFKKAVCCSRHNIYQKSTSKT